MCLLNFLFLFSVFIIISLFLLLLLIVYYSEVTNEEKQYKLQIDTIHFLSAR